MDRRNFLLSLLAVPLAFQRWSEPTGIRVELPVWDYSTLKKADQDYLGICTSCSERQPDGTYVVTVRLFS